MMYSVSNSESNQNMDAPSNVVLVSTGRTGTRAIAFWMKKNFHDVSAYHEPFPSRFLRPVSHMYRAGLISPGLMAELLSIAYRTRRVFSSNEKYFEASPYLRSCLDVLNHAYNDPLIIHVVRDPRAYVSSYINHGAFTGIKGFFSELFPYWQLKPEHVEQAPVRTWRQMTVHERICWRWNILNHLIEEGTRDLAVGKYILLRFEDIIDPEKQGLRPVIKAFMPELDNSNPPATLTLRSNESRETVHPSYDMWSEDMLEILERHCGARMKKYGYK